MANAFLHDPTFLFALRATLLWITPEFGDQMHYTQCDATREKLVMMEARADISVFSAPQRTVVVLDSSNWSLY